MSFRPDYEGLIVQSSLQLPAPFSTTAYCDLSLEKDKRLIFFIDPVYPHHFPPS